MRVLLKTSRLSGALAVGCMLIVSGGALADNIYKYRSADGTILFTDQAQEQVGQQYTLLSVRKGWSYTPRALSNAQRDQYDTIITQAATASAWTLHWSKPLSTPSPCSTTTPFHGLAPRVLCS